MLLLILDCLKNNYYTLTINMAPLMTWSLSKNIAAVSKYTSFGIYGRNLEQNSKNKLRKFSASSFVIALKTVEGYYLGYLLALPIQKLANDFQYAEGFFKKFPEIKKFIDSPNFIYYCAAAFAFIMLASLVVATALDYRKGTQKQDTVVTQDLTLSIQNGSVKTSPVLMLPILLFTLAQRIRGFIMKSCTPNTYNIDANFEPMNSELMIGN